MNSRHWAGFSRTALSVAVAILAAAPALAQNTTAAVGGRITGADGKPVAGANVTILHRESGSVNKVLADDQGRYSARGLRVGGPYTITFSKGGVTETRNDVFLLLAEATSLDAQIGGTTLAKVEITGSAASKFNSGNMGAGTNIGRKELDAYASIARNLQDYARSDPRLSQTDKERGEISALGQNSRFNSITVDGVRTNDTFGLEANNLPTAKQPISIDAIQSVQINLSNFDVTQQGYTGANINAVTKSGTNEFKGSVYYVTRDDHLVGERFNRTDASYLKAPAFKENTKGFTLGGPIIKDKLFFFGGFEELRSTRGAPDFGPLGSAMTNVGITPAAIAKAQEIAKNTYKIDVGGSEVPPGTELVVKDTLLKLDWNITDQHRANVRYSKTEQAEPFFYNFSNRELSLSSHWTSQKKNLETVVGQWFADWTDIFSTEFKVSSRKYSSIFANNSTLPQIALSFPGALPTGSATGVATGTRTLRFGTEQSRHFNELTTDTRDIYLGGNLALKDHELKFGADISDNTIFNAFLQNVNGNYTFGCITGAYSFGNLASCSTATAAQIEAATLENFQRGRPTNFTVQVPAVGGALADGVAQWSMRNTGLFLQDTWVVNKDLTVTLGGRLDTLNMPDKPKANAAAAAPLVAGDPASNKRQSGGFGRDNSVTPDGQNLFQPRVGFNWNVGGLERKLQVRGGVGLFQGAAATVWLSNPYSNTGVATRIVGCGGSFAACPLTDPGIFNPDPTKQPTSFAGSTPAANVDFLSKDLAQPSVWKLNLALDSELPWGGMVAGAEMLLTKTDSGIYFHHLNMGAPTRKGLDGRDLFYTASGYKTECWSAGGSLISGGTACPDNRTRALSNPAFANVVEAVKTTGGGGGALTLSLSSAARSALGWQVAYTRTNATEVSPLTSSVSNSNFNSRAILNPNEEVAANSNYLVQDRVNGSLNWSRAFIGSYKTTFGLFYEGRKGKPFSWTFNNDLNGDGVAGNDLMYVPSKPGSGEVVFYGKDPAEASANEAKFWAVVDANSALSDAKGGVVKRNSDFAKFTNSFDVRLSQEVPGFMAGHKGVLTFDILNVGNLLNKRWGRIDEIAFQSGGGLARSFVNYKGLDANGKYVYAVADVEDYVTRQVKGESQWAAQVTLKYEF